MSKLDEQLKNLGLDELMDEPKKVETKLAPLTKAEKVKAADGVSKSLNKQFETIVLQKMGKRVGQRLPSISTELISLDEDIFGCGGAPRGRIIEIFGENGSGKTSLALKVVAQAQKAGGLAAFIDAEHALDPSYAHRIGVNVDELLISQPDYGEQALEITEALIDARCVDVIVIDSVSALVPRSELEGDMGDASMGSQARLMSQAMRKLIGKANKSGTCVIFLNQTREKVGVSFGDPTVTSGGKALKFYASVRVKVRQLSKTDGGIILEGDKRVGQRCRLEAVKNKVGGAPYAQTDLNLLYSIGWDEKDDMVEYAIKLGIVTPGAWHVFEGEKLRRKDLTNPEIYERIVKSVGKSLEERAKKLKEEL